MMSDPLWTPTKHLAQNCAISDFMRFVEQRRHKGDNFFDGDYHKLYAWSIANLNDFWMDVFNYTGFRHSVPPVKAVDDTASIESIPSWFPSCVTNYADNVLHGGHPDEVAIYACHEGRYQVPCLTYGQLTNQVNAVAQGLRALGVEAGHRVAGLLPNCMEAVICYLAASSIGAVWSSASPDFGVQGIVQRFNVVKPTVLFTVTHTFYRGRKFDQLQKVQHVVEALNPRPTRVIFIPVLPEINSHLASNGDAQTDGMGGDNADQVKLVEIISGEVYLKCRDRADDQLRGAVTGVANSCTFKEFLDSSMCTSDRGISESATVQLPFNHPLVIMFSSGTTGKPKCMLHSAGGSLLKHMCEQKLQCDFRPRDRVLYLTNIGWMMWNWLISAMALGSAIVLYEGCPFASNLWDLIDGLEVTALGTSAKWLAVSEERGLKPGRNYDLKKLRTILSTGSPLAPRSFDYVYREIKSDLLLGSISGGTDMLGCCVGCCPLLPVYRGQIQCRFLGMAVESWDENGQSSMDNKGELVIVRPFPSMPIGFCNDPDGKIYKQSYFMKFPHVWSHGDFIELHSSTQGLTIFGRSDATLNPSGIRFGSAEIYNLIEGLPGISDSLCVAQSNADRSDERVILLVKLTDNSAPDGPLPKELEQTIRAAIRSQLSPRFLPDVILCVSAIPYTLNGKKVELAIRRLFEGTPPELAFSKESLIDPSIVPLYAEMAQRLCPWT